MGSPRIRLLSREITEGTSKNMVLRVFFHTRRDHARPYSISKFGRVVFFIPEGTCPFLLYLQIQEGRFPQQEGTYQSVLISLGQHFQHYSMIPSKRTKPLDNTGHDHANVVSLDDSGHVGILLLSSVWVVVVASLSSGTVALTMMGSQRAPFLFVSWTPSLPFKEEQEEDDGGDDESTSPTFLR
jgi:hypothetical protein